MIHTETLVIGASLSGLAVAACLQQQRIPYIIIEKESQAAAPWHNHYHRLHLHTHKEISQLPFKKFDAAIPRYPSRRQVLDYLDSYQQSFNIQPVFNTTATAIAKQGRYWITSTGNEIYQSKFIVMATGPYSKARSLNVKGMETFTGSLLHSARYTTGKSYSGQKVLVVGFGNSACEIAIDLYEQGALPSMSVRSTVNIIPRDVFGIPVLKISLLMSHLPARLADFINAPLIRLLLGDITKLGLRKKAVGPLEEIEKNGTVPVLDIGIVDLLRQGLITVYEGIDHIDGNSVYFTGGKQAEFDVIVAGIGYDNQTANIFTVDQNRLDDLKLPLNRQQYFGKEGLYFCGFRIAPAGQIREIASNAKAIARHIAASRRIVR